MEFNEWYEENYDSIIKSDMQGVMKLAFYDLAKTVWDAAIASTSQPDHGCAGCDHNLGPSVDCGLPSLTPCPKEQSFDQGD